MIDDRYEPVGLAPIVIRIGGLIIRVEEGQPLPRSLEKVINEMLSEGRATVTVEPRS